jgi:hypothetical protein
MTGAATFGQKAFGVRFFSTGRSIAYTLRCFQRRLPNVFCTSSVHGHMIQLPNQSARI